MRELSQGVSDVMRDWKSFARFCRHLQKYRAFEEVGDLGEKWNETVELKSASKLICHKRQQYAEGKPEVQMFSTFSSVQNK